MGTEEEKKRCECGKVCYSKIEAQTVVNDAKKTFNRYRRKGACVHVKKYKGKIPVRIYPCDLCGFWHTTSHVEKREIRNKYDYRY